jgi:hypothetical protein
MLIPSKLMPALTYQLVLARTMLTTLIWYMLKWTQCSNSVTVGTTFAASTPLSSAARVVSHSSLHFPVHIF